MPLNDPSPSWRTISYQRTAYAFCEQYLCQPGVAAKFPAHTHAEYQLYLNHHLPYRYTYRRQSLTVGSNELSVFAPGEPHSGEDTDTRSAPSLFRLLYLMPDAWRGLCRERKRGGEAVPDFADVLHTDEGVTQTFVRTHRSLMTGSILVEHEAALIALFGSLLQKRDEPTPMGGEVVAVRIAREYLAANYNANVSLNDLSRETGLHPNYLHHAFCAQVGLPPHAYLINLRIGHAKRLLSSGIPAPQVAHAVGFADQSHFIRHFKRIVGVTPGRYRAAKRSPR
ncbi:MAG: helix-turn-helix transcriptional regulator [Fibrella sp.]|nr:helix-turn-helix transcriptional regulator [Armatimonadota bacterium]